MRILLVSYYAEAHLYSSAAQNTRFLASALLEQGHDVRVVCAGAKGETIIQDGYLLTKIPVTAPEWGRRRFGAWLPDARVRKAATEYFASWRPDVIYVGAWNFLTDFVMVGHELEIPIVQLVHDYSILCLQLWLLDSWGNLCDGPTTPDKCVNCVMHSLGWKGRLRDRLLFLPVMGRAVHAVLGETTVERPASRSALDALTHMKRYRDLVTLYIAQSPTVIDVFDSAGIDRSKCRFVPQYVGEDKLPRYPRSQGNPGEDRPVRFVYAGRWSREKGVDLLLSAFLSAETTHDIELWIISRNASAEKVQASTSKQLTSNREIKLHNNVEGAEVSKLLAQADVCIVPSICMELASRVVLEANAQGVPVIASSTVGNRYVIEDGVNGRIFPSGDVKSLAEIISAVCDKPDTIEQWSEKVSRPISRETWLAKMLSVFAEVVGERNMHPPTFPR